MIYEKKFKAFVFVGIKKNNLKEFEGKCADLKYFIYSAICIFFTFKAHVFI